MKETCDMNFRFDGCKRLVEACGEIKSIFQSVTSLKLPHILINFRSYIVISAAISQKTFRYREKHDKVFLSVP